MEDLIERCKNNERSAQEMLYEKYKAQVYRTALFFSRSKTLAEDITQETFIRVFTKIGLYDEDHKFETWLYKVVINVARNLFRKMKLEGIINPFKDEEETGDVWLFEDKLERKEQNLLLEGIIEELPLKCKEVIILKYFNDFSQEEISNILGIPIGTVKSRINAGLEKLRKKINEDISIKEVLHYE